MPYEYQIQTHIYCLMPSDYRVSPNLVTDWDYDKHAPYRNLRITNE